jgi:hypothetical protein
MPLNGRGPQGDESLRPPVCRRLRRYCPTDRSMDRPAKRRCCRPGRAEERPSLHPVNLGELEASADDLHIVQLDIPRLEESSHGFDRPRPGDVFAVELAMPQAPVQNADEPVRESSERLMVRRTSRPACVVVAASAR